MKINWLKYWQGFRSQLVRTTISTRVKYLSKVSSTNNILWDQEILPLVISSTEKKWYVHAKAIFFATSSSIYGNSKLCPNIHKFIIGSEILDFTLTYCISQGYLEKQNYLYTVFLSHLLVFISLSVIASLSFFLSVCVSVFLSSLSLTHRDSQIHTCAHIRRHRNCIDLAFMTGILESNMTFYTPKRQKTQSNLSWEAAWNRKPRCSPRITDNKSSLEDQENGVWWQSSIAAARLDKLAQNNGKDCTLLLSDFFKNIFRLLKDAPTHKPTHWRRV